MPDKTKSRFHPSRNVSYAQALRFRDAALFSFCLGRPLNEFVTINFKRAGIEGVQNARYRILKQLGDWLTRAAGFAACYVWMIENPPRPDSGMLPGIHIHICVHLPPELRERFRDRMDIWVTNAGGDVVRGAVHAKCIRHSHPGSDPELYIRSGIYGLVRYLLKGIDPEFAPSLHIEPLYQGVVVGKRLGYSQALGAQHRWHLNYFPKYKGIWIGSRTVRRRHWVRAVCPDFLEGFQR